MKYVIGFMLGVCLLGCTQRELHVQRSIEPFGDPSVSTDASFGVQGSELAIAQIMPLLERQGLRPLPPEQEPRWQLDIQEIIQASSPSRVLHEYEVADGGPLRRERNYYQVKPWMVTVLVSDALMATEEPKKVTGMAIEDPAPDQRHEQGVWIIGERTVQAIRGGPARVERAALASVAEQLATFFEVLQDGQRIEIKLDTTDMAAQGTENELHLAASGQHEQALEQLLSKVDTGSPQVLYNIAVLYDILGVYDEALQWYGRAVEALPSEDYRAALDACFERSQQATVLPKGWL